MEIFLTYRGKIPSMRTDLASVWEMRRAFHHQLAKLRNTDPFDLLKESPYDKASKELSGQVFYPFYGSHVLVQVALEIVLLSGAHSRQAVLSAGDLDNRLKRIVDALRMPAQSNEVLPERPIADTTYCLMDDDSAVSRVSIKLGSYLASDDPSESFAFIRATGTPEKVTIDNIAMLF